MSSVTQDAEAATAPAVSSSTTPDISTPAGDAPSEPSNTLKRKQSQDPVEPEPSSKKARISPEPAAQPDESAEVRQDSTSQTEEPESRRTNGSTQEEKEDAIAIDASVEAATPAPQEDRDVGSQKTDAPPQRKSLQPVDERKRNRRLFGAVFGALGQNASPQLARRREIDRKQREKLRAQAEEDDVAREARLARLTAARKIEQRRFDRESMRIRHDNMRAMASSLRTRTEPRLYYRPWELRPEQQQTIDRQIREAEETIAQELRDYEEAEARREKKKEKRVPADDGQAPVPPEAQQDTLMDDAQDNTQPSRSEQPEERPGKTEGEKPPDEAPSSGPAVGESGPGAQRDEPDDAGDEEPDMDGDDAVIY